jgi:hypothetical protein
MATASERTVAARIAANTRWAGEDDRSAATASARRSSPGSLEYWLKKADPENELAYEARVKKAESMKKAYFDRFALAGRKARAAKRAKERAA